MEIAVWPQQDDAVSPKGQSFYRFGPVLLCQFGLALSEL
jgi:hypothetical protein